MIEIISATADLLTIIGSSLAITLEVRRARREARNAGGGDVCEDMEE
ncbi:hypothetical protein [Streptomyces sp. NBC_01565]|nr:hypothetical protein [Streptomyces sp. NBC_01565]MCX4546608.1 hypothetical protein [Streptomyces sp. NBC_01565]